MEGDCDTNFHYPSLIKGWENALRSEGLTRACDLRKYRTSHPSKFYPWSVELFTVSGVWQWTMPGVCCTQEKKYKHFSYWSALEKLSKLLRVFQWTCMELFIVVTNLQLLVLAEYQFNIRKWFRPVFTLDKTNERPDNSVSIGPKANVRCDVRSGDQVLPTRWTCFLKVSDSSNLKCEYIGR